MDTLNVNLKLNNLHCYDEGDGPGSAEPYLWTVFFKIDGSNCVVNANLALQGTATVVSTPGNQGDLPNHDVDPGENVPIPVALGEFSTQLKPIPLLVPVGDFKEVGGVTGVIVVLMEQDSTPSSAIAKGHTALNNAVRDSLNALIPTLTFAHREPTKEEIDAMKKKIGDTVESAISNDVSIWDWLGGLGNMDDQIGSEVIRFSHDELAARGVSGISISQRFKNEGDWEIQGSVTGVPVNATTGGLRVAVSGVPNTVTTAQISVAGPGFARTVNKTTTLTGLLPGAYTITPHGFSTGLPNKPSCKMFTPTTPTEHATVTPGQIANASVGYTSAPCNA
jgi:hypothetical protein